MTEVHYGVICVGVLILLDFLTGIVKAIVQNDLRSSIMREGLGHKFAYVIVLFLGWFLQVESEHLPLGFAVPLFVPVVVAISLIEVTSILENCTEINPELKENKVLSLFANEKKK